MQIDIDKEVALLQRMTVGQLREKFEETWGEPTNTRNKQWLIKRIAWKLQANAEGDISERARRLAHQIAMETDIRTSLPRVNRPAYHGNAGNGNDHDFAACRQSDSITWGQLGQELQGSQYPSHGATELI